MVEVHLDSIRAIELLLEDFIIIDVEERSDDDALEMLELYEVRAHHVSDIAELRASQDSELSEINSDEDSFALGETEENTIMYNQDTSKNTKIQNMIKI